MPINLIFGVAMATSVFGDWQKISPADVLKPVPEFVYQVSSLGSVGPRYRNNPLPVECAVIEEGDVVGYRLSCLRAE